MLKYILVFILFQQVLSANEVNTLQEINIYNEDINQNTDKNDFIEDYSSEDIEETIANSIDDILRISPGATTSGGPRSSGEQVQIRGLNAKKLFTYIDGVKQNFRTDHSSMVAMDPDNLKSVEIYKSTSAISKGGSLGGGIVFTTKDALDYLDNDEKAASSYKFSHQTSNQEKYYNIKTFAKHKNQDFLLSLGSREAQDTKLSDRTILDNSSYKDFNLSSKYGYKLSTNEKIKLSASYFNRRDSAPMNPTLNPPLDIEELNGDNEIAKTTLSLDYSNRPKHQRFLNLNSHFYTVKQSLEKTRKSDLQYELREITTTGISISNQFSLRYFNLEIGAEVIEDKLKGKRSGAKLASYPSGKSVESSVFMQFDIPVGPYFKVILGARFQDYSLISDNPLHEKKTASAISKKLEAIITPIEGVNLSATYSEGFNAPKVQDVYVDGLHHKGDGFFIADNYFIPNYDLNHETSKMLEVGFKYERPIFRSDDLLTIKLNQYWNQASHYIYYEKTDRAIFDNEFGTTKFINIPNVSLKGREFGFDYLLQSVEAGMTYTQVRGVNKEKQIYLSDMPADQYTFSLKYFLDKDQITLGYLGISTLKQDRINSHTLERTDETPGYFTHNVFMTKKFSRSELRGLSFTTRVDNLTNRRYRKHASNLSEVGLDIKLSINYKLNHY